MKKHPLSYLTAILCGFAFLSGNLHAQVPNLINYQGRVVVGTTNFNSPPNGQFKFALVNATGNTAYWSNDNSLPLTPGAITPASQPSAVVSMVVTKGLYSVLLGDTAVAGMPQAIPASAFAAGDVRLRVWFSDGSGFQLLTPDQRLAPAAYLSDASVTSAKIADASVVSSKIGSAAVGLNQIAPNAITAGNIATGQAVKSLNGLTDAITLSAGANVSLTPAGNNIQISSSGGATSGWALGGNGGTTISNFLGTTDSRALELRVNNQRVLRLEPNGTGGLPGPNLIGGYSGNTVTTGQSGNTTSGGGTSGYINSNLGSYGSIGGGLGNQIEINTYETTIAGGNQNSIRTNAFRSTIGGGFQNNITANTATISGGESNTVTQPFGTVAGGKDNVSAGTRSAIGGGSSNSAVGLDATIPGGLSNHANGDWSLAAGQQAGALHDGCFVWNDSLTHAVIVPYNSTAPNQFCINANGGLQCSSGTSIFFGSAKRQMVNLFGTQYGVGVQVATEYFRSNGNFAWYVGGSHDDGNLNSGGGATAMKLESGFLTVSGAGNEQAYIGGDGSVPADIQIGSRNAAVTKVAAYNTATNSYMRVVCSVLEIVGGADVAEPFQMSKPEISKGSVVVIDDEHPGQLKQSDRAYDRRVAGIVSGANGINPGIALQQDGAIEGGQNVALSGRVYVLADASDGAIKPGDMLTTSATPGHAMKATDHHRAQGAIIGKAMSTLDEGRGMVLVLVTLQ